MEWKENIDVYIHKTKQKLLSLYQIKNVKKKHVFDPLYVWYTLSLRIHSLLLPCGCTLITSRHIHFTTHIIIINYLLISNNLVEFFFSVLWCCIFDIFTIQILNQENKTKHLLLQPMKQAVLIIGIYSNLWNGCFSLY